MCNLYSITTNQAAIRCAVPRRQPLRRQPAADARRVSRLSGSGGPQHRRPGREMIMMRWGMPPPPRTGGPPVTNIRNTSSPHWRGWLKPENRCLVPFNSFAEYAPEPNPETKKKDVVWFALNDDRPLTCLRRHLDRVQGRPRHQVEADPRAASRLWLPDDVAERGRRADPSQGDAGDPDDRRGARCLDARAVGRGEGVAAAIAG